MCVGILQLSKDCQYRSHANSNYSSPNQETVPELNSLSQQVKVLSGHTGRDLENRQR